MSIRQSVILGLLAAFLAGCSQPTVPDPDSDAQSSAAPGDDSMSEQAPMDDDGMGGGGEFFDDDEAAMTMIIYFDFDKSELRAEYADVLARHASGLSNNSRTSLRLEGHTDERGSREYNIGLGERRSQSVRRMLLIQGASTDQISTVSFGEERPVAFGSDEDAFQQNRRVEIKYTN
jgi:peptidoglycan-associated lipoprotein